MASVQSARFVTALAAILAIGCGKDRDPMRIHLRDFDNGPALADTLKRLVPPGTSLNAAWEIMQKSGFKCGERAGTTIDTTAGKVGSGTPYLQCWESTPINLGLKRREWTVTFQYDSAGVRDVRAGYIIQP
jgi:hypothetical protein